MEYVAPTQYPCSCGGATGRVPPAAITTATNMASDATLFQNETTDEVQQYRTLSKMAVAAAILANLSLLAFLFVPLVALPIVATLVAAIAVVVTRRNVDRVTGQSLALAALVESPAILLLAIAVHVYTYATEVPGDYQRISFYELNPHLPDHPAHPVPDTARALNGKKVFVKGYMHPGVQSFGEIKNFVLVPDMKTCCFGGQPKPWDMIEVRLKEPEKLNYTRRPLRVCGVLTVNEDQRELPGDIIGGFYELDADIAQ